MPRAASITYEDVAAIADRLKAAGKRPSPRLILEEHGSGSLGTIHPLLKQWEGRQAQVGDNNITLSPVLQRALLEYVGQQVAGAKVELEEKLALSEQAAADLARENERQNSQLEENAALIVQLQEQLATAGGRAQQMETDLADAQERAARAQHEAESARTELAKAELRLEAMPRLESDLESVRVELQSERSARHAADQAAAVAAAQRDGLQERLDEAKARADQVAGRFDQVADEAKRVSTELSNTRVSLEAAQTRLDAVTREADSLRAGLQDAKAEARAAQQELAELRSQTPRP